jgi:hypothetical protein
MDEHTAALAASIAGRVLTPGQPGYADEIAPFNQTAVHTPDVAVAVRSADDVAAAIRFAAGRGWPVAVQSTGHSRPSVSGGVLISTRALDGIAIDPESGIATLGAGARWGDVVAAAAESGWFPITGSATTVGVVGFLVGGGLGPLARSHGFGSDHLVAATVVTGTGEITVASADDHADLFWALRGGKARLGIVTELQLQLVRLSTIYGGSLTFAEEHIETVLRGWLDWTADAADDVSTSVAITNFPDADFLPPRLRGRRLLFLRFAYPGSTNTGRELAAPLRALAPVAQDDLGEMSVTEIAKIHNDPTNPAPSKITGLLLDHADQGLADEILTRYGSGGTSPFLGIEIRHLGAATRADVAEGSAVSGRDAGFVMDSVAVDPSTFAEVLPAAIVELHAALAPWTSAESSPNFMADYTPEQFARAWPAAAWERLERIRDRYDPDHVLI